MPKMTNNKKWESIHIFFSGDIYSYQCDRIILEVVYELLKKCYEEKWIEKYFFIRYPELGSHVRLRFFGNSETLNDEFKRCCNETIIKSLPKDLIDYPFKRALLNSNDEPIKETTPYLWIPYEPEIERYGGNKAIEVAEELFFYSSEVVIDLLKKIENGEKSSRLGFGLILFVITVYAFFSDLEKAKSFLKTYSEGYLKSRSNDEEEFMEMQNSFDKAFENQSLKLVEYVNTIWDALETNSDLGDIFDNYKRRVYQIKSVIKTLSKEEKITRYNNTLIKNFDDAFRTIVPSYIHMTNNRLGIPIPEESYLAHIILLAIENSKIPNKIGGE